mgnify:CR=1 FL=1
MNSTTFADRHVNRFVASQSFMIVLNAAKMDVSAQRDTSDMKMVLASPTNNVTHSYSQSLKYSKNQNFMFKNLNQFILNLYQF